MANNERARKKDSARLVWDSKPRRAPNPRDIEFQIALGVTRARLIVYGSTSAAIYRNGLSGDGTGLLRAEEQRQIGNVLGLDDTTNG